jgi:DNA-directed RNA polymerase subunit K/omega
MLYGRRLDQSLSHVDGSRYALVHAVAKRARQITLWLTADPAELRAESAPPPAPGELVTRDPVALAEAEILDGEVRVRWDPEGLGDDGVVGLAEVVEADPLLLETLEEDEAEGGGAGEELTPALAQVLEGADDAEPEAEETPVASVAAVADADGELESGDIEVVSLDDDSDDDEDDED